MDRATGLSIGQLNLQGSALATTELPVVARELSLDLVLVQEQYGGTGGIVGHTPDSKAGIMVLSPDIVLTFLDSMSSEHCAVAHISSRRRGVDIYVLSVYCQYSHDINTYLEQVGRALDKLAGRQVLVGVDSNAHSPMWHCESRQLVGRGPDAEYRRAQMEGFILGRDLRVCNVEGQPPTFSSPNGCSNIDITIVSRGVSVSGWTVHEGASTSDHQLITFTVGGPEVRDRRVRQLTAINTRNAFREQGVDYAKFRNALHHRVGRIKPTGSAEEQCRGYTAALMDAAEVALGRRSGGHRGGYEWWSAELDEHRRRVYGARRAWQQARKRNMPNAEDAHRTLRNLRQEYKGAMRRAEETFLREIAEEGNDDPWGLAYRAATGRVRPPSNILHEVIPTGGGQASATTTAGETAALLLGALCPDDDPSGDSVHHRQIRLAAATVPSGASSGPPSAAVLDRIVRDLPNTAPGLDGVTARIVRHAWTVSWVEMLAMYSACLREGVFPSIWKVGRLVVLPKGNDRPPSDPKAYRPVTLLPVLGKILERLIIACAPCLHSGISQSQHGSTRGKSTVTALKAILDRAAGSAGSYVQLIFLDISGAFDNAWWPMVLLKAKNARCPPNIYRTLLSYFCDRRVGLFVGDQAVWKVSTMGCPQGSVLGPTLWNLLLDDILKLPLPEGVSMVAYADDVTIVIEAPNRAAIERNAQRTLDEVAKWGVTNRLSFSAEKSATLTIKGKFKRPPTIRMNGASIAHVTHAKVLGVVIDEVGSYVPHAKLAGQQAVNAFGKMSRVSASSWGVRYRALRVLYAGTYVAILCYAAAVWWRRYDKYVVRSTLLRTQRPALILLTKAYRSVSTAALPVLAGVLPADLELYRAGRLEQECSGGLSGRERSAARRRVNGEVMALWQARWESSSDGRELFRFFPDVEDRMSYGWVEPDYAVSQILTGHGCFRGRLHALSLCNTEMCECGDAVETRDHVLWECAMYRKEREEMLQDWCREQSGPVMHRELVSSKEGFGRLKVFAHKWHASRRSLDS